MPAGTLRYVLANDPILPYGGVLQLPWIPAGVLGLIASFALFDEHLKEQADGELLVAKKLHHLL
ncbi:MAG: hypothetical protein KI789_12425, partial [Hoeflea sp.]|nr:hypothetical protein [Hoeflea sp.]